MPRKEPKPVDNTRRLKKDGGKIWDGVSYGRGDEAKLPADFPMDGPWWSDWLDEPGQPTHPRTGRLLLDGEHAKNPVELQGPGGARSASQRDRDDSPSYSRDDEQAGEMDQTYNIDDENEDADYEPVTAPRYDTAAAQRAPRKALVRTWESETGETETPAPVAVKAPARKSTAKKRKR